MLQHLISVIHEQNPLNYILAQHLSTEITEGLNVPQKKQQKAFAARESESYIWLSTIKSAVEKNPKSLFRLPCKSLNINI